MAEHISGVYQIKNPCTGGAYVGSATDIALRWMYHRRDLRAGRHDNHHLQRQWDTHGPESLSFEIIERVDDIERLRDREQLWLDRARAANTPCYNICPNTRGRLGVPHTPAARERMSAAQRRRGRAWSRLTEAQVRAIVSALRAGERYPAIARRFGVDAGTIGSIARGRTWTSITGGPVARPTSALCGEEVGTSKLKDQQVQEIIRRRRHGEAQVRIAKAFGISQVLVSRIDRGEAWAHVPR